MPMDTKDKLKILLVMVLIAIPIVAITPFGVKQMRAWGVDGSKFWMGNAIWVSKATLRSETAATYMREYFLLWPEDPKSAKKLVEAANLFYDLGTTAERTDQNRLMARSWIIFAKIKEGEFERITYWLGETEKEIKLRGLGENDKSLVENRMKALRDWCNKNQGTTEFEETTLLERAQFPDKWQKSLVR